MLCALTCLVVSCSTATGPVEIDEAAVPDGQQAACERLVDALPEQVADLDRREVEPADALGAAWGDPPIVLRCGVGRPDDYDPVEGCTTVNGIDWYIPLEQLEANGERDLTMTTLNRDVAVEVLMPGDYWPPATTLADLSAVVADHTERTGRCR